MAKDVARPEEQQDLIEAVKRLVDQTNDQARVGLVHSGIVKTGLALTTANLEVSHQLGRVPSVVLAVKLGGNAVVYSDTVHADPRHFIYLRASATVTADVLVA
jgi:hypothetical protein